MSRSLLFTLILAALAMPLAGAQQYVVAEHVFAFSFADAQPIVGTQQTLFIDVFDNSTGIPVSGLADVLSVSLVLGDASKEFTLVDSEDVVGRYVLRFLPTQPGNYTARVTGRVGETDIEVVAELPAIAGREALEFPEPLTTQARLDELEARVDSAKKGVPGLGALGALAALSLVALSRRLPGGGR